MDAPHGSDGPILMVSASTPLEVRETPEGYETHPVTGGLVSTLGPVMRKCAGTWLGGIPCESQRSAPFALSGEGYRVAALPLSHSEMEGYFDGFANGTLWPLLHSLPMHTRFDPGHWKSYREVNERFARAALDEASADGVVWFHDHHLMVAPAILRKLRPPLPILFFLHVPFPAYDLFRLLPWHREILNGLLAADFVGFQVAGYAANFYDCAERLLGARVDRESGMVKAGGRCTRVAVVPMGVDFDRFAGLARESARPHGLPERMLVAADRLEYTKGVPERLRMMEHLLDRHPEQRERTGLLQVTLPPGSTGAEEHDSRRETDALKREIDELVGRVNGRFATATWSPIRYLYQACSQEELAAIYRYADVGLATPLRDGMNLFAKEFVACRVGEPGVLVLSELAGAAEGMREAVLVNPHDLEGTADAVHAALCMAGGERARRMDALRQRERRNDVHAWMARFLEASRQPAA
jgi:trehalose 6-phosphate synthase/phosphatase